MMLPIARLSVVYRELFVVLEMLSATGVRASVASFAPPHLTSEVMIIPPHLAIDLLVSRMTLLSLTRLVLNLFTPMLTVSAI